MVFPVLTMSYNASRSSLEEMLDSIRQRDLRPKDTPPALPVRPVSKARLPSSRRPLSVNLKANGVASEHSMNDSGEKEKKKRDRKTPKVERVLPAESPYVRNVENLGCERRLEENNSSDIRIAPSNLSLLVEESKLGENVGFVPRKIAALEDARKQMLQSILTVQKIFRGHQACRHFNTLKREITNVQSFIRGENARKGFQLLIQRQRAVILIQKRIKHQLARALDDRQRAAILLQSEIRGWLIRRHYHSVHNLGESDLNTQARKQQGLEFSELKASKDEPVQVHSSVLTELKRQLMEAEAKLGCKENENAILRQSLRKFKTRWWEYDARMKCMEEMWQKQMTSLQVTLASAKMSLAADDTKGQPGRPGISSVSHCYDSEDTVSMEACTPEASTPTIYPNINLDVSQGRDSKTGLNAVSYMVKEFEQRKQVFPDDAKFLSDVKSGESDADDELRKLKLRFEAWKKEYKVHLTETKATIQKLGSLESDKTRKRWWGKKSTTRWI